MTVAFERSTSNRSPSTNVALSATPASRARLRASATISGLNSTPMAVAPRLAAVITVMPLPEPRSMTTSDAVTFARSSILSTVACGVGTHTTSLPAWPDVGSKVCCVTATSCAATVTDTRESSAAANARAARVMPVMRSSLPARYLDLDRDGQPVRTRC